MAPSGVFDNDNDPHGAATMREETDVASHYAAAAAVSNAAPNPDANPPAEIFDPSTLSQEQRQAAICEFLSSRTNDVGRINKGAADEVAKKYGISKSGASAIWRKHKLAIMHPEKFKLDFSRKKGSGGKRKHSVEEILERVKRVKFPYRQSLRSLAAKTGIPKTTLRNALKLAGDITYSKTVQAGNDKKEIEAASTAREMKSEIPVAPHPCQIKFTAGVQNQKSKVVTGGSLQGVVYPNRAKVPGENLPSLTKETTYEVKVPETIVQPSDGSATMSCAINGADKEIKIPKGLKKDDTFTFTRTDSETEKVFTSTLPSVPGMDVVQSKPIIWSSVSYAFYKGPADADHQATGNVVGKLTQEAQVKILEQVVEHRCNACLGLSFNVTTDSSGESGNRKLIIVTAHGTPCVVVSTATASSNNDAAGKPQPFG